MDVHEPQDTPEDEPLYGRYKMVRSVKWVDEVIVANIVEYWIKLGVDWVWQLYHEVVWSNSNCVRP